MISPVVGVAEEKRTLQDESIYDLLVDRFNNGDFENDLDTDTRNPSKFSGGDFAGIIDRLEYFSEMGFTLISVGPIFSTETYDGSEVLDYEKLEPHFGTKEDFTKMIDAIHEKNIGVVADFPLNGVSENHVWVKDGLLPTVPASEGTVDWVHTDAEVKGMLKDAIVSFVNAYELEGIRITDLGQFDIAYLNEVIAAVKDAKPNMYVFTTEATQAEFDGAPNFEKSEAIQQAYVTYDPDTSQLSLFNDNVDTDFIQFDELTGPRFTHKMVEERMFPPARWKLALAALFTLPGVPVVTYETEMAVNGKEAPESHPL